MRRRPLLALPAFVAVLLAVLAGALVAQPLPAASPAAVLEHLRILSQQNGPRAAGTPGDLRAVDYVAGELARIGYAVERQPFPFQYFEETQPPLLTVVGEAPRRLAPSTMLYSASTPEEGIEAEVVAAGLGRPADFSGLRVEGKIVLVQRGEIFFRDKVANAAAAGALAVLIVNNQPGGAVVGTLMAPAKLPAVAISQDEGQDLLRRLAAGPVRVRLVVRTISEERISMNVIGVRRGTALPGEVVVVGAHRDSVPTSPGANDNASGTAALLEAGRLLAGVRTARTVHVVAFGAEELGLIGSRFYAQHPPGRIVGMVNLDMVGRGVLSVGNSSDDTTLVDLAERIAARLQLPVARFKLRSGASDHAAFEEIGVPAVFIHTGDDPAIHTPNDIVDRIDPLLVARAATLAAHVALEVAGPSR
ncbi:MAG: M28 family metallopeptidase [Armatimonadota bacterium]|nr:M28 family metallopeptidase [Armatimonadota bacterium]MDR7450283.1 M28 family metallopeptidase [Armatimonadota bacterium]MDR7467134.1 M28 family metallopeptidase [Armatimonadota bacterium]MDR7493324.1 M28 family metallopeptidase [Armatimonadota bacterium]MDR7499332.1 M28 family metallopeptidase [Armatimonadota bacterium]